MVPALTRKAATRIGLAATLAGLAWIAPRLALLAAMLLSIMWVARRDNDTGTWGVLYVVFLLIVAILTMLVAGLALIHRLMSG